MCGRNPAAASAVMGRSTDAEGDGNVRKNSSPQILNFQLDALRFIDAPCFGFGGDD
jgi:hypothetical protein